METMLRFLLNLLLLSISLANQLSSDEYLSLADDALSRGSNERAIEMYKAGLDSLEENASLLTLLSLETNLASALSAVGLNEESIDHYHKAISAYTTAMEDEDTDLDEETEGFAKDIASTASFYLGMVLQDIGEGQKAVEAYGYTIILDPKHWAALANLGSVLHDHLRNHDEALAAYNKAYEILTQTEYEPTDPPEEPRFVLSQLQYRIGLCLSHNVDRKCAVADNPDTPVSCKEMATHAFALAVKYDDTNESAKHMLATITADASMKRASNQYVRELFDDYSSTFEHSLTVDLNYDGYMRLRRGFDRALGDNPNPNFSLAIDAGCGTGLVGEQFRNVSSYLIGVDLSAAILDEAEKLRPGLYNERIVGDLTDIFRERKPISLIIAADSYIYFGDLEPLFQAMEEGLEDNGLAAFTLENVDAETEATLNESKPDWRWQLTASGRFAHRKEYVESIGHQHHLKVMHYESLDGFRHEHGKDVRGHMFVMAKTLSNGNEL